MKAIKILLLIGCMGLMTSATAMDSAEKKEFVRSIIDDLETTFSWVGISIASQNIEEARHGLVQADKQMKRLADLTGNVPSDIVSQWNRLVNQTMKKKAAATDIQRVWRGHQGKIDLDWMKDYRSDLDGYIASDKEMLAKAIRERSAKRAHYIVLNTDDELSYPHKVKMMTTRQHQELLALHQAALDAEKDIAQRKIAHAWHQRVDRNIKREVAHAERDNQIREDEAFARRLQAEENAAAGQQR